MLIRFVAIVLIEYLLVAVVGDTARGQVQRVANQHPGMTKSLPDVPIQNPRFLEGPNPDQRWRTERPAPDKSMAAFVDSVKGNDAAIHVVVEQGRLLTVRDPIASAERTAAIAVGDQTILDFEVMPNPRMLRLIGLRAGVTDLSIVTSTGDVYNFEVYVGWDLHLLDAQLRASFPDAKLKLSQLREHVVIEGEARDSAQVRQILFLVENFLRSVQPEKQTRQTGSDLPEEQPQPAEQPEDGGDEAPDDGQAGGEAGDRPSAHVTFAAAQIINLIRVPGVQQVMLKVRIGELDRKSLRRIGGDVLYMNDNGSAVGTQIGGNTAENFLEGLVLGSNATFFGVFPTGDFEFVLNALRDNSVLTLLAEPNLVAMSGHEASFLAGGEFPVPVQTGNVSGNVSVQFKDFGVQLVFIPYVLDDETIRLNVSPEVSTVDDTLGTTLVPGGDPVPGVSTRRTSTTVELKQGQTLALAGLLEVGMEADTSRIPLLGDIPYIGALFSNSSHERAERELIVMVTPYLVSPMDEDEAAPLPGTEVEDPNDHEFYFLRRIEGRTGNNFRSTTSWDDPLGLVEHLELERKFISGDVGHSH